VLATVITVTALIMACKVSGYFNASGDPLCVMGLWMLVLLAILPWVILATRGGYRVILTGAASAMAGLFAANALGTFLICLVEPYASHISPELLAFHGLSALGLILLTGLPWGILTLTERLCPQETLGTHSN
jgi:hypothetical protein